MAVQPKLVVGSPGDAFEQEADRVAEQVVRAPAGEFAATRTSSGALVRSATVPRPAKAGGVASAKAQRFLGNASDEEFEDGMLQRQCASCDELVQRRAAMGTGEEEEEERIQASNAGPRLPAVSARNEAYIHSLNGRGEPLPEPVRSGFEQQMGYSFEGVRVHTDAAASQSARELNALAYTVGPHVVFGPGRYDPGSTAGRRLLAHELTHVVQQGAATPIRSHDGARATSSNPSIQRRTDSGSTIQRKEGEDEYAVGKEVLVVTPKGGNLMLRHKPTHERDLYGRDCGGKVDTCPNTRGNIESGSRAIIKEVLKYDWFFVEVDTVEDGRRGGYVHKDYLKPVGAASSTTAKSKPGETPPEAIPAGGTEINKLGIVYKDDGANVRDEADPNAKPAGRFPFNTTLSVIKSFGGGWYYVTDLETGKIGYVDSSRVWTHLPEPNAKLHKIQSGESAIGIAEKYYKSQVEWGQDLRYYVNVLVHVNKGEGDTTRGIYKVDKDDSWKEVKTRANYLIWIPSVDFAKTLVASVKSGSISYEISQAVAKLYQPLGDLTAAVMLAKNHIVKAVKNRIKEAIQEILISLAILIVGAAAILAVSTALGAAIGALAGGVGAGAGAKIGFEVGLAIIKWLGLAMLVAWIVEGVAKIGAAFWRFLTKAWNAGGDKKTLDEAAAEFADAIALTLALILQALVFWAIRAGGTKVVGQVANTRFGKWIGATRLGKWIGERLATKPAEPGKPGEKPEVPEAVKGKKFGLEKEGYEPDRIFQDWIPKPIPSEGWKLHVSADPASAPRIAEIVLPLLRAQNVPHKVVNSPETLAEMKGTQVGKFITIYPENAAQAKAIAKTVDGALKGKGLKGPRIEGEKLIGESGLVYTRYGGFTKSTVTHPSGKEVPDVRGQIKPDWIPDPWAGEVKAPPPMGPMPDFVTGPLKED